MTLLLISFIAGLLTVLAPCVLPILPIIIGGSIAHAVPDRRHSTERILLIIGSLAVSVIVFSLLLKATTTLLGVPQAVWQYIAGGIVILIGINFLFPTLWLTLSGWAKLGIRSNATLAKANTRSGTIGAILTGAALGPVFSSCSPTYALILAAVLPSSFALGLLYLIAYVAGMSLLLFLVAYFGASLTRKLGWALDEHGTFHRVLGILFIIVGLSVIIGFDKSVQSWLLERGVYDGTSGLEEQF